MNTVPEPEQVREGRQRIQNGERLPEHAGRRRPFYCRGCGAQQESVLVPRGWYTLTRATGTVEGKPVRLGLYCSIRCLDEQMERLVGIQDDLGDTFDSAPSEFRQRGTWTGP